MIYGQNGQKLVSIDDLDSITVGEKDGKYFLIGNNDEKGQMVLGEYTTLDRAVSAFTLLEPYYRYDIPKDDEVEMMFELACKMDELNEWISQMIEKKDSQE